MLLQALVTPAGILILILIMISVIVACICSKKQRDKPPDKGKLIQRETDFWDRSESFTVEGIALEDVFTRLPADDLKDNVGSYILQPEQNRIVFVHNGNEESYTGTLSLISADNGTNTFRLLINQYKTCGSSPNAESLDALYTAVERVFLEIDPEIEVTTKFVDRKTRHNII